MGRDYFAELFVAGRFADAGWNVYFPHRDMGFDFIVTRPDGNGGQLIRPVQVKGKYRKTSTPRRVYGYVGKLTQLHPDMVLAIPFFPGRDLQEPPAFVAYMPRLTIKKSKRGYQCQPATFEDGPVPRRDFKAFFDEPGLKLVQTRQWPQLEVTEGSGRPLRRERG